MAEIQSETLTTSKVIKITFPEPVKGKTEWYFGSIEAAYEVFTHEDLGVRKFTLQAHKFDYKSTRKCVIQKLTIYRKAQQRKKKSK